MHFTGKDDDEPPTKADAYDEDAPEDYYVEDAFRRSVRSEHAVEEESEYESSSSDEDSDMYTNAFESPKKPKNG